MAHFRPDQIPEDIRNYFEEVRGERVAHPT